MTYLLHTSHIYICDLKPFKYKNMTNFNWKELKNPLWKNKLTDRQFEDLKNELKAAYKENKQLFRFDKHATLYYANWWSREYVGGNRDSFPSKEKIAADLGIKPIQSEELFNWAKRGLSNLNMTPIFRNGRNQYFRTLLLQGGLPLKSLKEGNNKANYGAFLEGLIKYTNERNIDNEDISFIDYLPCKNRLSPSFQTPDFYEMNLMIIDDFRENGDQSEYWDLINAIFDKDNEKAKVEEIKKLLSEGKERRNNTKKIFSANWSVRINDDEVSLYYTLLLPQKIKKEDINESLRSQYEFSVFLNNKEIAKYNRTLLDNNGNVYFIKYRGKNEITEKCIVNTDVTLRLSCNGTYEELPFTVPDFSDPKLLYGNEMLWHFTKQDDEDNKLAVLILNDSDWEVNKSDVIKSVNYFDTDANWIESKDSIILRNKNTGKFLEFDNKPYLYRLEIVQRPEIRSTNRKLINDKVKFRVIYNIDNEIVSKRFKIIYRTKSENWQEFSNANLLPVGLINFEVTYPDNKVEYVSFYNVGNISITYPNQTANSGVISFSNWHGNVNIENNQPGVKCIENLENNQWKLERDDKSRFYANTIKCRIKNGQGSHADILIPPPFKGVVATEIGGKIIRNQTTIALHSLWRYKCMVLGNDGITITISHNKNPQNKRNFKYKLNKKNEIPFSDFEESIKNLFILFGTDHTDFESYITIQLSNDYSIIVKQFNVNIIREEWKTNKLVKLDTDSTINRLFAMTVDCDYADEIDVIELTKQGNDFVLPSISEDIKGVIVFSDDNSSTDKVRPTYLGIEQNAQTIDERLNMISDELSKAHCLKDVWGKILIYFRWLINNNLPLRTIDYFKVISESPSYMAKFSLILLHNKDSISPDERINGLLKLENEFALAWHWIDIKTWNEAFDWFKETHNDKKDFYIQYILTNSLLIDYGQISELYHNLSDKIVENDCPIDEQKYIKEYGKYLDFKSDDWLVKDENERVVFPELGNWRDLVKKLSYLFNPFLFSPAKAALSAMGEDVDKDGNKLLWLPGNEIQRRIIFYFWKLNPQAYTELYLVMVKKINYRLNQLK